MKKIVKHGVNEIQNQKLILGAKLFLNTNSLLADLLRKSFLFANGKKLEK